jgi:6,7-dimethyl-8-ribityllumazine synthase
MSTPGNALDGSGVRVALVVSRFNDFVTTKLLAGAEACLEGHGCSESARTVVWVPGAWEIPQAAQRLARSGAYDAIVALGALIRGETSHFDYLAQQVSRGLGQVGLSSGVPTIFGVLTTETVEQALARAGGGSGNKGREAALAALQMVRLFRELDRQSAG